MDRFDLSVIALKNPRLAYVLFVNKARFIPRMFQITCTFDTGAAGDILEGELHDQMASDAWIRSCEYTIRAPRSYTGNPLKPMYDAFGKLAPYVDVDLYTTGLHPIQNLHITEDWCPLELAAKAAQTSDPYRTMFGDYFVIEKWQNFRLRMRLARALADDEIPYEVTLAFKVDQIDGCTFCELNNDAVISALTSAGILGKVA